MEKLFKAIFHDGNIIWLDALMHEPVNDKLPDSHLSEHWGAIPLGGIIRLFYLSHAYS